MRTQSNFSSEGLIVIKNADWLERQRIAGKITAGALILLERQIKEKSLLSLLELNHLAEQFIQDHQCGPTFKGYKGFPAGVCISVNKQLVHGIPTSYYLQEGDVVSFDLGVTYKGAIADSALTCIYGEPKSQEHVRLIQSTKECLTKGIEAIKMEARIGSIGYAISRCAKNSGFGLITKYGGHGLSENKPHDVPFVANKAEPTEGIRFQPGLTLAIEPMLIMGDTYTYTDKDGWTVWGNGISSHFEHTIFIHEDHVEIITARE
jgi:methionyl aminopeptidase